MNESRLSDADRGRRRMLGAGTAMVAGSWVAPSVLRLDRIAAATGSVGNYSACYLHNNPTPPVGDTASQLNLPLDSTTPTATTLYNYDDDRDSVAGLLIEKGGGLTETDPVKFQRWRLTTGSPLTLSGTASLNLWSVMKDFTSGKKATIEAGLYDCDSTDTSCVLFASNTLALDPWPDSWQEVTVDLGSISRTIPSGNALVIHLSVLGSSDDDLWFAYDTTTYDSNLSIA